MALDLEAGPHCRDLFDLVPCYISVQDPEFRIVEANRRFKERFGNRVGARCYEVYKGRPDRCPRCPVAETLQDGAIHTSEEVLVDSAGNETFVVVHTAPIRDEDGNIAAVMEVSDDVTEIHLLQDQLASLGRLVGGIAHSIKNVLEGLRGGVYVVNLGFRDNNQEDIRTGWEMVQRNVARISAMVMDMLYCARERSPRHLAVPLAEVALEVVNLFAGRARDLGINLRLEAADTGTVPGEPKDIHALISNLVTNAIDACAADEDERKAYEVTVRVFREPRFAVIEVKDNGPGMDGESCARLFAGMFSTKGASGTGLGLLVCHKVATEHRGTIAVESQPGAGSTFTVRLPLEMSNGSK